MVRNPPAVAGDARDGFSPWGGEIPEEEMASHSHVLPMYSMNRGACGLQSRGSQRMGHE